MLARSPWLARVRARIPVSKLPPLRLTLLWHERFHSDPWRRWMRELIARTSGKIAEYSESTTPSKREDAL